MADRTAEGTGFFLVPGGLGIRWGGLRYLAYWGLLSGVLVLVLGLVGFVSLPSVHWAMGTFGSSPANPAGKDPAVGGRDSELPSGHPPRRAAPRRLRLQEATPAPASGSPSDSACGTHACVEQATRIQAELEYSVDPCVDFYHFVCSRWIQRHPHASVDRLQLDTYLSAMADLLERAADDVPEMSRFFGNCIRPQENLFSEIRATFFYLLGFQDWPYLSSAAAFLSPDEVSSKIGAVFRELGVESLFRFAIAPDPEKPRLRYWALNEPRLLTATSSPGLSAGGGGGSWLDGGYKALLDFYGKFSETNVSQLERDLIGLMERPEVDPLALTRCKTMALVDMPAIDYLRWAPLLRSAFGTDDIYSQDLVKLACPGYVLGLFNRGALPRATDLLNYLLFRIVVVLSPFMANATLRDAMSRAYGAPGESSPPTPRQLCVRLLDRFEPVIPMYLATNMSLSYLGPEEVVQDLLEGHLQVVFEKYVDEFFASTGDFRSSSLQALRDMTWDLVRPSTIEDASFRRQYLDGLYSNMPMSPLAYFYYFWLKKAVARQLRGVGSHSPGSQLWAGWSGGFLSALPRLEPPFRRLELPLPVFNLALTDDASVRHFQIPRVAPRVYAELLRFLYHRALNNKGNLTDAAEDPAAMFERVRACVREQYAPLRSSPAERGSSVQDALELLAVVPAFEAYRSHLTSDFRLQTASDLSGRQLFFVYFAASLCEDESLGVGPGRSPARLRVNGPLRNMPEFADAFKCPVGSFMNPTKVCAL
ncbi:hypothetical protein ISCGN_005861 [Ixodes scapularis]